MAKNKVKRNNSFWLIGVLIVICAAALIPVEYKVARIIAALLGVGFIILYFVSKKKHTVE